MTSSLWTRRESLQLLGLAGAGGIAPGFVSPVIAAAGQPCALAAEVTVGPFYVDSEHVRSDITEGKAGLPLKLRVTVMNSNTCAPIRNSAVDIWHCDARGYYSGYTKYNPDIDFGAQVDGPRRGGEGGGPPGGRAGGPIGDRAGGPPGDRAGGPPGGVLTMPTTDEQRFLRGVQLTNSRGVAEFLTVYPGWYYARATHIHLKVHVDGIASGKSDAAKYGGGHVCHVGQLCFPDDLNDRVAQTPAYTKRELVRTLNNEDTVFDDLALGQGMVQLKQAKRRDLAAGLVGEVLVTVDPTATPGPAPGFRRLSTQRPPQV
jgi:protocatechuate 3,4-dioxygenase beta subunit